MTEIPPTEQSIAEETPDWPRYSVAPPERTANTREIHAKVDNEAFGSDGVRDDAVDTSVGQFRIELCRAVDGGDVIRLVNPLFGFQLRMDRSRLCPGHSFSLS